MTMPVVVISKIRQWLSGRWLGRGKGEDRGGEWCGDVIMGSRAGSCLGVTGISSCTAEKMGGRYE